MLLLRQNCDKVYLMKLSIQLKRKDDAEYYVYIGLSHKTSRTLIATPYSISAEYVKEGKIINRAKYAEIYNKELLKYEEKMAKIVAPDKLDIKTIKDILTATTVEREEVVEFFSNAYKEIDKMEKMKPESRSPKIYRYNIGTFQQYIGRDKLYTFEMTRKMIQGYIDTMLRGGKAPATISNNIATIRNMFYSIREEYNDYDLGILNIKNDPFKKLQLPQLTGNSGMKALSVGDIRKVINTELTKGKGYRLAVLELARDYFLLSFFLLGINPVDMFMMKKDQMRDGRIVYSRSKTKRRIGGSEISIPVSSYAMEIINRHKGRGEYLLDMQQYYDNVEGVVNMVSRSLIKMYPLLGLDIDKEHFSWYSARHTWASIAANECHFSDAEVARALNHQSEHKVTRGYIRPDWSLLDRMNEAVLAVIFG